MYDAVKLLIVNVQYAATLHWGFKASHLIRKGSG